MNYINCVVRFFEIPTIELYQNEIPWTRFKVEIAPARNRPNDTIVEAIVWGDLAYDLIKYYRINDYVLIEGYLLTNPSTNTKDLTLNKKVVQLNIFQIYPFFSKI